MPREKTPRSSPMMDRAPAPRALGADLCTAGATLVATMVALLAIAPWDLEVSRALGGVFGATFGAFIQDWGRKPASVLVVGAAFALTSRAVRVSRPLLARASAALLAQVVLHSALLTNLVKLVVGRPRPVHLGPAGEGFAAFTALAPGFGDFSFPSGHVAVAMILAPCALLLWREGRRRASAAVATTTLAWAGVVALGRVSHGAHFPTDVAASIGLGVALAPLSVRLGDRILWSLATRGRRGSDGRRPA